LTTIPRDQSASGVQLTAMSSAVSVAPGPRHSRCLIRIATAAIRWGSRVQTAFAARDQDACGQRKPSFARRRTQSRPPRRAGRYALIARARATRRAARSSRRRRSIGRVRLRSHRARRKARPRKCNPHFCVSRPYARSTRNGPSGVRTRTPAP
jgi:hypothetical protein